jgi:hypothetical protein
MGNDAISRTESIGPDVNTSIPGERIVSDIYLPAYGMPWGISSLFYNSWRREMEGLTIDAGRPLTRAEYDAWSTHIAPRINITGGASLLATAWLLTVPFSKKTTFPGLGKGPPNPSIFPSARRPFVQGRVARALWKVARGSYILTLSTCSIAFLGLLLKNNAMDRANHDKTLENYWRDRRTNGLGLLKELNLDVLHVQKPTAASGITVHVQRRDADGKLGEPEGGMRVTELLAIRSAFNEGITRRSVEGTWHRIGREGRDQDGPTSGSDDGEQQTWQQEQRSGQEEQQSEQRENEQTWQDQERLHDRPTSWDSIRASVNASRDVIKQQQQQQQQQQPILQQQQRSTKEVENAPVPAPASSSGIDSSSPWTADNSLDDASPVAPSHQGTTNMSMGAVNALPAKTWDQIRQENRERTQQRQQQRQQPPQPQSQQQNQQAQGTSSWDAIRSRNHRQPEEDHTYTEEQLSRETAKQQAQDQFDKMIERERKASGADDPGRKW